jgi:hypothetical protein
MFNVFPNVLCVQKPFPPIYTFLLGPIKSVKEGFYCINKFIDFKYFSAARLVCLIFKISLIKDHEMNLGFRIMSLLCQLKTVALKFNNNNNKINSLQRYIIA